MHRRSFFAASAGFAAIHGADAAAGEQRHQGVDYRGRMRADLPTPALLVNLEAFDANLRAMADHCKKAGIGFRPHAKTHKCSEMRDKSRPGRAFASRPCRSGGDGRAGIRGVLLTSPILSRARSHGRAGAKGGSNARWVMRAKREMLSEAARKAGVTVDVLIDVDVGDRRTGVLPGEPAVELARLVPRQESALRHTGFTLATSHVVGFAQPRKTSREAMGRARARTLCQGQPQRAPFSPAAALGTYNIDSAIRGVTERCGRLYRVHGRRLSSHRRPQ